MKILGWLLKPVAFVLVTFTILLMMPTLAVVRIVDREWYE